MPSVRWQNWLNLITPTTGRYRMENGDYINVADFVEVKQREEISTQSLLGNAWAASVKRTISAGASVDYVLEVPEGIRFYLHSRQQTAVGGSLDIQLLSGPDAGYTAAETVKGRNLDSTITDLSGASIIRTEAATTGATFLREEILYPPGTGNNVSTASTTGVDAIPQYTSAAMPVLRISNSGNDSALVVVNFVWAELDEPSA